jgi:thiamine monophosphate kinase
VWLDRLPAAAGATLEQVACGGEDFELLAAVAPGVGLPGWVREVGELTAGDVVRLIDGSGVAHDLYGWEHFR